MTLRAAGLVIFRRIAEQVEYLLLQTSYGEHHWTPPKGHVDPGESDMKTALRETEEESGLADCDLKIMDFKKELHYSARGKSKDVVYWLAELVNSAAPIKLSDEHQAYEWAELERACQLVGYKDMQDLLHDCNIFINNEINQC